MPWKETRVVDERMRFVLAAEAGEEAFAAVCRRFGISRQHGVKWLARWRAEGVAGLADRSRAPLHHPQAVAAELAEACLDVRRAHPTWGPVKVRAWLERKRPSGAPWPAASTIGGLFDREGLTVKRKLRRRGPPGGPLFAADGGQRRLDHRLQGLVPHRRRHPRRPADAQRRLQPLPPALPGGGAPRHRACLADPRRRLPRVRPAAARSLASPTTGRLSPPSARAGSRGSRSG